MERGRVPLIPKESAIRSAGSNKSSLIPRASLKPKKQPINLLAPKQEVIDQIENEKNIRARGNKKSKITDHNKNFKKWYKIMEDGALLMAEEITGRTKMRVIFNPKLEHFMLQHVDLEGKASTYKITFPVALMILLRKALRHAELSNIIKNGRAECVMPEE